MPIRPYPSTIITLVLTAAYATSCSAFEFNCDHLVFTDRKVSRMVELHPDQTAELWHGGRVDPATPEGCEALCTEHHAGPVTEIHYCKAIMGPTFDGAEPDTAVAGDSGTNTHHKARINCVFSGSDPCIGGRHTDLLVQRANGEGVDAVAAWLAREACGEAGSVLAFRQLARELRHHGAPSALIAAARSAAADEVRHTRMVHRLARRRGGSPAAVHAQPTSPRDLLTIAMENAVEGCVHETFAAARAGWQARHAQDAEVRAVSAVLAQDEARHADLAAAVHDWIQTVLPSKQADAVETARKNAWASLAKAPPKTTREANRRLGLPDAHTHRRLVQAMANKLAA